jgi:phosphoglycerol transferase MdoB-like AlkP superfamily enzyme
MKIRIHYLIRLVLFWLIYFTLFRLVFIAWHYDKLPDGHLTDTFLALFAGYRLDLSTAAYFLLLPFMLWSIQQFVHHRIIHGINLAFNILLIFIVALVCIGNIRMFSEWGTLLNARALAYLEHPQEVLNFASTGSVVLALIVWLLCGLLGVVIYRSFVTNFSFPVDKLWMRITQIAVFVILIFTGIRGGWQLTPVNESAAFYSVHPINNKIATNSVWYLVHSIAEAGSQKNPYVYMSSEQAAQRTQLLLSSGGTTEQIINTKRPNIVFIVLESWVADIIDEKNVTPQFNELAKEGLIFTQAYASGFRTDQGLAAILSGFPAQPNNSIITTPSKAEKLPSISNVLKKDGYTTSFYYGGDIEFANMKTYLLGCGFDKMTDKASFTKEEYNSKWGAHDGSVLNKQAEAMKKEKRPFFSVILTLSTHEPFEVPIRTPFDSYDDLPNKFRKAAYYTDQCLREYFLKAKVDGWYDSTLFVLVADHGHHLPKEIDIGNPSTHRITMMLCGGALKEEYRGKKIERITEQTAIASTLLEQIGKDHSVFTWSRNAFAKDYKEFAYYSLEPMLGWVTPQQDVLFYFNPPRADVQAKKDSTLNDSLLLDSKAYLQSLYEQYLQY